MKASFRIVGVVIIILAAAYGIGRIVPLSFSPLSAASSSTDSRVVRSIARDEKVVLLALSMVGLDEEKNTASLYGVTIPGTERSTFIKYSYTAQLGLDGSKVSIEKTGDNEYTVCVPRFEFLGFDDPSFETVLENNGVLSFATPNVDAAQTVSEILNSDAKQKHVDDNRALLESQCESFYTGIIHGVAPEVSVNFSYVVD